MRKTVRSLAVMLGLATGVAFVGAAAAGTPHPEFEAQQASIEELAGLEGDEFEIGYVNRLVPHHEGPS